MIWIGLINIFFFFFFVFHSFGIAVCLKKSWMCFDSVNNKLEMNTWVSYEVLPAFYTVDSFSGCFATDLLTSHVHTSHVVFVRWAHFLFVTLRWIHILSHIHIYNKRFQMKETISKEMTAKSWQQWLPTLLILHTHTHIYTLIQVGWLLYTSVQKLGSVR